MAASLPIFYVDDDTDDLEMFLDAAADLGLETILFSEPDKMLKALYNPPPKPAVIFVDLNMPQMSGLELIDEIKTTDFLVDIPIVVLSTAADKANVIKSRQLGASYYVQKPVSLAALKKAVLYVATIDWSSHNPDENFLHNHD
jgi:CheY-like chemotaxis protein